MDTISVLLADDHPVVREGYRTLIGTTGDIRVTAEAACSEQAYDLFRRHHPDVAVIDVNMPGEGGFGTANRILHHDPAARLVFFSVHASPPMVSRAFKLGVRGYLSKQADPQLLLEAIRTVHRGERYLEPLLAVDLETAPDASLDELSKREFEVFRLLAAGQSMQEISNALSISPKTAAIHRQHILDKLRLDNLVQLAHIGIAAGVVDLWRRRS